MAGIIRAARTNTYDQLPRAALQNAGLSYRARGVLARLLTNADGASMTSIELAAEGLEGREAVRTALAELRRAGYVRAVKRQLPNGRWTTETYVFESPIATEDGFPGVGNPGVGTPGSGGPGAGLPEPGSSGAKSTATAKARAEAKSSSSTVAPGDRTAAAACDPESSAAAAPRKRKRVHAGTSVVYWYDDEVVRIERMVEAFGAGALRAAVATLTARGVDPLPNAVDTFLTAARREARRATSAQAPPDDPAARAAARARANAMLDQYEALQGTTDGE